MREDLSLQAFLPYRCTNVAERISMSLSRIYVQEFGVSIPEWRTLATLAEYGELQAKQVGERTNMDKVRVSRAVTALLERKLLLRRPCREDNRASLLSLSARGRRLYQRIVPQALAWEQSLLQPLSAGERRALFSLLDKLDGRLLQMGE